MRADRIVLIAGITGLLGSKIAAAVRSKGIMRVRGFVRPFGSSRNQDRRRRLQAEGVELMDGDLSEMDSVERACQGVEAVVSAVQGGPDVIVDGQLNLLRAAQAAGVRRFVPSDFAVDCMKLDYGDNDNLDWRKRVAEAVLESGMGYTFVLNGPFTEVLFEPFLGIFDLARAAFRYWGDGDMLFETTTSDDIARYLAEALTDPAMEKAKLRIAGSVLTMKELHSAYERASGKTLTAHQLGSVDALRASIETRKKLGKPLREYIADQYLYCLVSGKGRSDALDNDRYPHIQPETVEQYVRKAKL